MAVFKSVLLNQYHTRLALSQMPGHAPYFQLGRVQFGHGLEGKQSEEDQLKDIPLDLDKLESVFGETDATYSFLNGAITITAIMPKSQIPDGEGRNWNMCSLLDTDGVLVGALITVPQVVTNQHDIAITLKIDSTEATRKLVVV